MDKVIYERNHHFTALFNGLTEIWVAIMVLLIVVGLVFGMEDLQPWKRWIGLLLLLSLLVGLVFDISIKCKRYIDLNIKKHPSAVITDDNLQIYNPFGSPTIISWSEIEDFKVVAAKLWTSCHPIYKDQARNKKRIVANTHRDSIRTDYLAISEEELLEEFRKHLEK